MALAGELAPVVIIALAVDLSAPITPEHHGQLLSAAPIVVRIELRGEHVDIEAVFIIVRRPCEDAQCLDLRALRAIGGRLQNSRPPGMLNRRHPPQTADGRCGVRNAEKLGDAVFDEALDRTLFGLDFEVRRGGGLKKRACCRNCEDDTHADICFLRPLLVVFREYPACISSHG